MNKKYVGDGKVELITGGGRIYTDIAARFVKSERDLKEIIGSEYNKKIVKNIISAGHEAAVEFDWFIFGVSGYSRVTETQLVRKRLASYMIKSGRVEHDGKRSFDVVLPEGIEDVYANYWVKPENIRLANGKSIKELYPNINSMVELDYKAEDILAIIKHWYEAGIAQGIPEEDLRYLKPQATEFKALIGMNAHALRDWFRIRCCKNAQAEIRDMAMKMLKLCRENAPDLFEDAGPNCVRLGYCPENDFQHKDCVGKIPTKDTALKILKDQYKKKFFQCDTCGMHQRGPDYKKGDDCVINNCDGKLVFAGYEYFGERGLKDN